MVVLTRILGNLRQIRAYRRELVVKAQSLHMNTMLACADTTRTRHLHKASSLDAELHLVVH